MVFRTGDSKLTRAWRFEDRCKAVLFDTVFEMAVHAPDCKKDLVVCEAFILNVTKILRDLNVWSWDYCVQTKTVNSTPTAHTFFSCAFCQRACPSLLSQLARYIQPHSQALTPRTHTRGPRNHGAFCQCLAPKQSHFIAQCHMLHFTGLHRARALLPCLRHCLPRMSYIHLSASINPVEICGHLWVALWLSTDRSQVLSPSSLLKNRITGISPKTSISQHTRILPNTRIYVSTPCPPTNRSQRRLTNLRKASRHRSWTWTLGRWASSSSACFTTVLTGARIKCKTIASFSLGTRQLDVQFMSRSDKYRGNLSLWLEAKTGCIKKRFPIEKLFPWDINRFFGSKEPFFRFSSLVNAAKSLLDGNREHLLAEARFQLKKQESLDTYILEQQRLELEGAHSGCAESLREQVRHLEELDMTGKALRETRISSIHEMKELRRAKELRVDEFSVQKLRESHWYNTDSLHKYRREWMARIIQENFKM